MSRKMTPEVKARLAAAKARRAAGPPRTLRQVGRADWAAAAQGATEPCHGPWSHLTVRSAGDRLMDCRRVTGITFVFDRADDPRHLCRWARLKHAPAGFEDELRRHLPHRVVLLESYDGVSRPAWVFPAVAALHALALAFRVGNEMALAQLAAKYLAGVTERVTQVKPAVGSRVHVWGVDARGTVTARRGGYLHFTRDDDGLDDCVLDDQDRREVLDCDPGAVRERAARKAAEVDALFARFGFDAQPLAGEGSP